MDKIRQLNRTLCEIFRSSNSDKDGCNFSVSSIRFLGAEYCKFRFCCGHSMTEGLAVNFSYQEATDFLQRLYSAFEVVMAAPGVGDKYFESAPSHYIGTHADNGIVGVFTTKNEDGATAHLVIKVKERPTSCVGLKAWVLHDLIDATKKAFTSLGWESTPLFERNLRASQRRLVS